MTTQNKTAEVSEAAMATGHLSERREPRYAINFHIEVSGIDRNGQVFRIQTHTLNVSEWGCGFNSPVELRKDSIVAIRTIPDDPTAPRRDPVFFQIVRVQANGDAWQIGAWKMADGSAWGADLEKLSNPASSDRDARRETTAVTGAACEDSKP